MVEHLVSLDLQAELAIISLNRPERHNALIPELLSALVETLADENCQTARVVILRAEGQSFSIGGDMLGFHQHRDTITEYAYDLVGLLNRVIVALYSHPATIICAVQGQVTGGSLGLLLASDKVIMSRDATITPWYSVVGFNPDGGWAALLPEITGQQQTTQWLESNASHDADYCFDLGIVDQVVDGDCDEAAIYWANKIAKESDAKLQHRRHLLNISIDELNKRLEAERDLFVMQIQSRQALDGIDQFLRRQ